MKTPFPLLILLAKAAALFGIGTLGAETLPPLAGGKAPETFDELWAGFDPSKEPLDVEVLREWEQDGTVLKVLRYRVGIFKGRKAMLHPLHPRPIGARRAVGGKAIP